MMVQDIRKTFAGVSSIGFIFFYIVFLVLPCGSPLFAADIDNAEKQVEAENKLIEQYEKQQKLYEGLKKEFESHPVTKWRREIARNKKAIAVLDKQLRDMVRFENEEQIEELRQKNEELQKKIEVKKDEWEILEKKLNATKKQLESLEKRLGRATVEEVPKDSN